MHSRGRGRRLDVIAAILTEGLPADDERRTFTVLYTAYFALSLTDSALAIAPLVKNSGEPRSAPHEDTRGGPDERPAACAP